MAGRRVAGVLLLGFLAGCGEPGHERAGVAPPAPVALEAGESWQVVRRFAPERTPARLPPTATLADETRPVLEAFEPVTLNYSPHYRVPGDGRFRMTPPLPASMEHDAVFLAVRVKPDERWLSLPGRRVATRHERGKLRVHVDLELPEAAGREAGVWVQAVAPGAESRHDTPPFSVPARARLDYAIAVLEPAWGAGAVEFEVEACAPDGAACQPIDRARVDPARAADRDFLERRVSLAALAGREISLRFHARPLGEGARSLPVWADPILLAPGPSERGGPNLILVSLDTLRADHMGVYGHALDTTPFLDALAEQGVLFERYLAAASSTRPSHMTMFTSLQPSVHGATENTGVRALPTGAATLAELLREAGVATAAFTENGAIDRARGFARGFATWVEDRDAERADLRTGRIEETFARGLRWLDDLGERRFFLFLHTYQVHNPFTPPPPYASLFEGEGLAPPPGLRADWNPLLYDREIRYADDRVRALVTALRERGRLENAYLVVTSDHGEAFLEHGFVAHGASVHHEVLHVPLIVTGPELPAGHRVREAVPMLDLMPTLLELMGVEGSGLEMGRSQAAALRGAPAPPADDRPLFSEAWAERAYRAHGFDVVLQPTLALQLGDWKLIRSRAGSDDFRYELYDLSRDPRETRDLHRERPEQTARLAGMLERYQSAVGELHDRLAESPAAAPDVDPDLEEKLRALGYLD